MSISARAAARKPFSAMNASRKAQQVQPELTPQQVRDMAVAVGIHIDDEDLVDVTLRLNATLEHFASLDQVELDATAFLNVKAL